ncbi:M15 family metallopeptidase [Paenibacillus peoriae]|uniref:M15 family metallopeptidase n=1 Tax=Paenibacillus peoriae TaxID=59893 RepID=UPI002DB62ED7|nr:M15 family metallopeptidase [Paenibacillus peoriae]
MAEQNELYAQGRTKPGPKVTNAKGGTSYHNFGVAVDFALLLPDGRSVSWDTKLDGNADRKAGWIQVVDIAKDLGFEWGGDWKTFTDLPHFQMVFGLSTAQYRAGKRHTQHNLMKL